ncbi:MAG: VOC family protein [Bryobacteraceae bacterium]
MRTYLASRGVKLFEEIRKDKLGDSSMTFFDPEGHSMEIVQYREDGLAGQSKGKFMPASRVATHFDHAGVLFNDIEPAIQFYSDFLGLRPDRGPRLTFLATGDPLDRLEIGTAKQPRSPERFGIKNHICLSSPDAVKAVEMLTSKRISRKYRPVEAHLLGGKHVANYYDPDGTRVELMEPGATDKR